MTNTLMEHAAKAAFPDNAHGALVAAFREAFAMGWQAALQSLDLNELAQAIRTIDGNHTMGAGELAERLLAHLVAEPKVKEGARWRG